MKPKADLSGKTILQVIPELDAGGAERTTLEVAAAIIDAGGRALVASRGGRLADDIRAAGGVVLQTPVHSKNPLIMAANVRRLVGIIREEMVDLIHARSRAPAWSAFFAARRATIPFVTTYHGAYKSAGPLKRYYNSSMTRADRVIANSEFTAASIRAGGNVAKDRLVVIPRGADIDRFNPAVVDRPRVEALRTAWRLEGTEAAPVIVLPARLTDWKGQSVAIEAFAAFVKTAPSAKNAALILVGDDQGRSDYRDRLEREIAAYGLSDQVRLVGHVSDMPAVFALADLVLSPAIRPEAFGRVAAEAGAMARIVIAADHGGARETVLDGQTGFLTPPGEASALAIGITKALNMRHEQRLVMGEAAREHIAAHYSISSMTAATLGVYASLMAGAGLGSSSVSATH
ncbi:MAG: glycosyltransferase family 4 protein [Pseudomonadota bacterium]